MQLGCTTSALWILKMLYYYTWRKTNVPFLIFSELFYVKCSEKGHWSSRCVDLYNEVHLWLTPLEVTNVFCSLIVYVWGNKLNVWWHQGYKGNNSRQDMAGEYGINRGKNYMISKTNIRTLQNKSFNVVFWVSVFKFSQIQSFWLDMFYSLWKTDTFLSHVYTVISVEWLLCQTSRQNTA